MDLRGKITVEDTSAQSEKTAEAYRHKTAAVETEVERLREELRAAEGKLREVRRSIVLRWKERLG